MGSKFKRNHPAWYLTWGHVRTGKSWKRLLHKCERKHWNNNRHVGSLKGLISTVNYKGW